MAVRAAAEIHRTTFPKVREHAWHFCSWKSHPTRCPTMNACQVPADMSGILCETQTPMLRLDRLVVPGREAGSADNFSTSAQVVRTVLPFAIKHACQCHVHRGQSWTSFLAFQAVAHHLKSMHDNSKMLANFQADLCLSKEELVLFPKRFPNLFTVRLGGMQRNTC